MKLTCSRPALAAALRTCAGVADKQATMPALAMVRLTAKGSTLRCSATDLNVAVSVDVPTKGDGGDVLVPAAEFAKAVDSLPGLEVTLALEGSGHLAARAGKARQVVPLSIPARDAPKLPVADGQWQSAESVPLAEVLRACIPAICADDTRFRLCGINLVSAHGVLRGDSTDGHRLHTFRRSWDAEVPIGIVPRASMGPSTNVDGDP